MKRCFRYYVAAGAMALFSQQSSAMVSIQFDYSFDDNNFFGSPGSTQRTLLESAGAFFASNINDSLTAITPDANNTFNANFTHPGTGAEQIVTNLMVPSNTLIVFAGGRSLPGTTVGQGGFGGAEITTAQSQAFIDNAFSRGQAGALGDPSTRTDFGPWGGTIAFDTDAATNWYFDTDLSTSDDVVDNDFYSVALHELGHLLGLGLAPSWNNLISGSDFTGAASSNLFGGNVPLADAGHWKDGTTGLVNGVSQEAAMDPSIRQGTRKEFTDLDLAGLNDVGWEVTVVPVPAAVWLFGSALMGLVVTARRRS